MEYFSNFPVVNYNGINLRNISQRIKLDDDIINSTENYLPYNLAFNEDMTRLAYDYYSDPNMYWLIAFANKIADPYYDWFINDEIIDNIMELEYGSTANAQSQIAYFARVPQNANDPYNFVVLNPTSFYSNTEAGNYQPVDYYQQAILENDEKRDVFIINNQLQSRIEQDLETILNGNLT
jgi:hypothetical protein